jgi:hypothetical protein
MVQPFQQQHGDQRCPNLDQQRIPAGACQCRDKTPAILPTLPICAAVNLGGDAVGTLQ